MPRTAKTRSGPAPMDPLEVLSGEPRKPGADSTTAAPDAAHWLTHPTTHDGTPSLDTEEGQMALLLSWGEAIRREDAEKWARNDPRKKP